jgi:hypothetical protein
MRVAFGTAAEETQTEQCSHEDNRYFAHAVSLRCYAPTVQEKQVLGMQKGTRWHPPVSDRPTLTLYARVGKGEVALGRWPTTGWKTIENSDGSMALKYKESVTGDAIWPEILATPTWHPATGHTQGLIALQALDTRTGIHANET